MRTAIAILLGLALLICAAEGFLLRAALAAIDREAATRHLLVVERIRAEADRRLADLVAAEDARPFTHWRHLYVPESSLPGLAALAVSPLAKPSPHPAIVGYVQVDPDGVLHTPSLPRDEDLIRLAEAWNDNAHAEERFTDLRRRVEPTLMGCLVTTAAPQQAQSLANLDAYLQVESSLNRSIQGAFGRRAPKAVDLNGNGAVANFSDPQAEMVQSAAVSQVLESSAQLQQMAVPEDWDQEGRQVRVDPFDEAAGAEDSLVLRRGVHIDGLVWNQMVILDRSRLQAWLEGELFGSDPPEGLTLAWGQGDPLAPPFATQHLSVNLPETTAELRARRRETVLAGGLVLAVTIAGFAALVVGLGQALRFTRRRQDFVAAVTHELKTPLTAIRLHGEMLRDGLVPAEKQAGYHGTIVAECERLSRLVGNVLDLARLERGGLQPRIVIGDPADCLREALRIVEPHLRDRGFEVDLVLPDQPSSARFDRDALVQVVLNLIDNAVKFSGDRREITLVLDSVADRPRVRLGDRGPGVADGDLPRIFAPFWRGGRELTRQTSGTGIGLALVRGLVQAMGGEVSARNREGGGLEVAVVLAPAT